MKNHVSSCAVIAFFLFFVSVAVYAGDGVVVAAPSSTEQHDRSVDRAALASQEQAITTLRGLMGRYRGTPKEAVFLAKLADLERQSASLKFRVAHGETHRSGGKKPPDMNAYKKAMRESIRTLDELIRKYPRYGEIAHAYFIRGRAYEEIGDKSLAAKDYLHLVTSHPDSEEVPAAYMSLAGFAIEAGDHDRAVGHLKNVEKKPDSPHYPFALYKLAWACFNLRNVEQAISYAERHVAYYNERRSDRKKAGGLLASADESFRENMLLDITVFYLEGFEQKPLQYDVPHALKLFRDLESGNPLGRMLARYAKLLRSHGHDAALIEWKNLVLKEEGARPEALDVLVVACEHHLNKRSFADLVAGARDMIAYYGSFPAHVEMPKARKLLLDAAGTLQTIVLKNKGSDGVGAYSRHLAAIYDAFTKIVEDSDPRIPRVHYNLAETLFEIRDFEGAAVHYRWVVEKSGAIKTKDRLDPADAGLKAIASRYESLKARGLVPKELKAQKMADKPFKELDAALVEWVSWLDEYKDEYGDGKKNDDVADNFYFEANRALYMAGAVKIAVERMTAYAADHPASRFAIPSVGLVLDTGVAGEDWEYVHSTARDFMEVRGLGGAGTTGGKEFERRLYDTAAGAYYKIIEAHHKAGGFKDVVGKAGKFEKNYVRDARFPDVLSLAGNAAMTLGDSKRAEAFFSRLLLVSPKSELAPAALLARASIREKHHEFRDSAGDYLSWLQQYGAKAEKKIRQKALALSWISGSGELLERALSTKQVCISELARDCATHRALRSVLAAGGGKDAIAAGDMLERSRKSEGAGKAIWAVAALGGAGGLQYHKRMQAVRFLASAWDDVDPLMRLALLPVISEAVPAAFSMTRAELKKISPLKPNARSITHRVEMIREIENTATRAMKLPWGRIRALALGEVASFYIGFSRELKALPAPKGLPAEELAAYEETVQKLVFPFEEKGQDMRLKAFEMASKAAIDEKALLQIATPYFEDNPSQARALAARKLQQRPAALDVALVARLDPGGGWRSLDRDAENATEVMRADWVEAVEKRNFGRAAYVMHAARENKLSGDVSLALMRVVALAAAGAQAEALQELKDVAGDLGDSNEKEAMDLVIDYQKYSYGN
ncbi:MAG: hypothetical protein A2583_09850 [Bdellovibrionales bacterium RIFOXYD1_FULL_53_11]|nr:MAG: hypothetical protein A2583_09850 [Bdellovibrionales bacterium RIFOXYD1_FULL_53_11]